MLNPRGFNQERDREYRLDGIMNEDLLLLKRLEYLRAEHRELDQRIRNEMLDEFTRQRLKKAKLEMRDQIVKLEQVVYPDIIA